MAEVRFSRSGFAFLNWLFKTGPNDSAGVTRQAMAVRPDGAQE
jgi:hypothetical protein